MQAFPKVWFACHSAIWKTSQNKEYFVHCNILWNTMEVCKMAQILRGHIYICVCVCVCVCVCILSCVQLFCDPMDYSLPGSSVHGILKARILEWVVISFSRGSSQPRDWTCISCISALAGRFLTSWATIYIYMECVQVRVSASLCGLQHLFA